MSEEQNVDAKILQVTANLADAEAEEVEKKIANITRMTLAIETILTEGGATWKDWCDIQTAFNNRTGAAVDSLKLSEVKEFYDRNSSRSTPK